MRARETFAGLTALCTLVAMQACAGATDPGAEIDPPVGTPPKVDSGSYTPPPPPSAGDASVDPPDPGTSTDSGTKHHHDGGSKSDSGGSSGDAGPPPAGVTPLGQFVMTWYSFQDNTPVNSIQSASGRPLIAYVSIAVPFRLLKSVNPTGTLNYGDRLYLEYLHGKMMPNGTVHSGWVEIDDFCGDNGKDDYCFQTVGGKSYPNTDLYIGDFTKSGMAPTAQKDCAGPAGSGQELTNVSIGDPGSQWIDDYGVPAVGTGKCGDYVSAESQQGGKTGGCWDYTPPTSSVKDCP